VRWLKVKVIEGGRAPERKTAGAAGLDCYAREDVRIMPYETRRIPLGFACEIPEGFAGMLVLRSSIASNGHVYAPSVGIIDSDYRGEVSAVMATHGNAYAVRKGDRIAQMVVVPVSYVAVSVVDELTSTERGSGGFGSTGR
jgi:dUTP pyrophosphatase